MLSKTLAIKKASFAVPKGWPLTEEDYLLNLSKKELAKLGPDARQAVRDYMAGRLRPIEELFEELRLKREMCGHSR